MTTRWQITAILMTLPPPLHQMHIHTKKCNFAVFLIDTSLMIIFITKCPKNKHAITNSFELLHIYL